VNFVSSARVIEIKEHHSDIREYNLILETPRKYKPGSFVQLSLELVTGSDIWPESRTFSVASYKENKMRFFVKRQGQYTNRIFNELRIGKVCTIKFPFGDLFDRKTIDEKHIFLAGGVGITPYFGLTEYFESLNRLSNLKLFYSVKEPSHFLYLDYLKERFKDKLYLYTTQTYSSEFRDSRITIEDINSHSNINDNIYICGNKSFNTFFKKGLNQLGYKKLHMDEWE
jgi:ferredoxin-NADP reductase